MSDDFTPLPCPFCGSHNVRVADRAYCDEDGEHDGVECLDCDAMNRLEHWNEGRETTGDYRAAFRRRST